MATAAVFRVRERKVTSAMAMVENLSVSHETALNLQAFQPLEYTYIPGDTLRHQIRLDVSGDIGDVQYTAVINLLAWFPASLGRFECERSDQCVCSSAIGGTQEAGTRDGRSYGDWHHAAVR